MKQKFRGARLNFLAFFVFLFSVGLVAAEKPKKILKGRLIRIEKPSPLYEKASQKSKILGDADKGTIVEVVQESPQGLWLQVKDEDKNTAWVPTIVTDAHKSEYKDPEPMPLQESITPIREKFSTSAAASKSRIFSEEIFSLAPTYRLGFSDPHKKSLYGVRSQYLKRQQISKQIAEYYGLLAGFDYAPESNGASGKVSALAFPLRLMGLRQSTGGFTRGPDAGIFLTRTRYGSLQSFILSASAGYNLGYVAPSSSYYFMFRSGFEFLVRNRISFEFSAGLIL